MRNFTVSILIVTAFRIWLSGGVFSGNGLAPNAFLILMTFNQQGRPCVFSPMVLYRKLKLALMICWIYKGMATRKLLDMQFDSGYWITSLYQVKTPNGSVFTAGLAS